MYPRRQNLRNLLCESHGSYIQCNDVKRLDVHSCVTWSSARSWFSQDARLVKRRYTRCNSGARLNFSPGGCLHRHHITDIPAASLPEQRSEGRCVSINNAFLVFSALFDPQDTTDRLLWLEICNLRNLYRVISHWRTTLWGLRFDMSVKVQCQADWLDKYLTNRPTN
jgi:hypothetical protein